MQGYDLTIYIFLFEILEQLELSWCAGESGTCQNFDNCRQYNTL